MPVSEGPDAKKGATQPAGASPEKANADATRGGKEAANHGALASKDGGGERALDKKRKDELPKSVID